MSTQGKRPRRSKFHVTSKFSKSELDGKSVEFHLIKGRKKLIGIGDFVVSQPDTLMLISIHSSTQAGENVFKVKLISLTQQESDAVCLHCDPKIAAFQVVFP